MSSRALSETWRRWNPQIAGEFTERSRFFAMINIGTDACGVRESVRNKRIIMGS